LLFNVEQARLTSNTNSQVIKKLEEGRFTGKGVTVIKKYSKLKSKASFAPYIKSFVELKVNPEIEKIQKFWEDFSQIHSDLSLINSISAKKQYCGLYQNDIMKNTFNFFNDQHPIGPFQSYTFGYTSMLEELGAPLICDQVDTTNLISNIKNKLLTLVITQLKNNKQILGNNSSTQLYCQEISKLKLSTEDSYFGPLVKKELERNEYQLSPIAGEGDLNQKNTFKFAYQLCW